MKRFALTMGTVAALGLVLTAPALAASSRRVSSQRVVAQATPTTECQIGEVCNVTQTGELNGSATINVKDPPGSTIRSLTFIAILAALFVVYLRWALQRGKAPS